MKLKPCPLCGSELLSVELGCLFHSEGDEKVPFIVCDDCSCSAPIEAWNSRAENTQPCNGETRSEINRADNRNVSGLEQFKQFFMTLSIF